MNIAILGLGKLGLPMAALYASAGHKIVGVDLDDTLIERLQLGTFHTDEPDVDTLLQQHAERLTFERLPAEAVLKADIVFVAVPTPSKADGTFDSSFVVTACSQIGTVLHDKKPYTLVVVVSTLMPGQMDSDIVPALERTSEKRAGIDFGVCYSPEFIALGRVLEGLRKPDYVLIGESDQNAGKMLRAFAMTVAAVECKRMSFVNAELAKLATNAYLSLKIAYANVLGQICEQLPGANVDVVTQAVGADHRIGGAYLRAGLPAGGVCLPRDLEAFATLAELSYVGDDVIVFLERMNDSHLINILLWIERAVDPDMEFADYTESHARIGILGVPYSPTTAIQDGSFALKLQRDLMDDHFEVMCIAEGQDEQAFVDSVDAVVLALPHERYRNLHFKVGQTVLDIWRVLDIPSPSMGVGYHQFGIGANPNPYKTTFKGVMTTLSVSLDEYDGGFEDE